MTQYCSPARFEMGIKDKTCLSTDELQDIAKSYNKSSPGKKKIKTKTPKATLVKDMQKKLGREDHMWLQQDFIDPSLKQKVMNKAFRPLKPIEWYKDRHTWLNTFDILKVMKQYETRYKDFFFLGVFPLDFKEKDANGYCVAPSMCEFSLRKMLDKGKRRFAMVINMDKHNESGSHWVALYCNLYSRRKNFGVYYYDSVAYGPPKEVAQFMQHIEKQVQSIFGKRLAARFAMRYNQTQKQFKDSDCGVFSEVFITQILKDVPFDEICTRMKTDNEINKLRDILYTPTHES
jgi:hypothetical protein